MLTTLCKGEHLISKVNQRSKPILRTTMMTMNTEQARFNMIEQQIRPAEVLNTALLDTIAETPREEFVLPEFKNLAFADLPVPIGNGQYMLTPIQEARFLQALNISPEDKILEVGTGSGYFTALLAKQGKHVTSVEIDPELSEFAAQNLKRQGITNVTLEVGDASQGWDSGAPFDVIAVTGSMPIYNGCFQKLLNPNGRALIVAGTAPTMSVLLVTRIDESQWSRESIFETVIPSLQNVEQPEAFVF